MKFIITQEMFDACTDFASKSLASSASKYAKRNQTNLDKISKDIRNGKLAEEGVYSIISQTLPNLSKPDHSIYDKKNKSWEPDLRDKVKNIKVAVKSQDVESAYAYGESWVFQYREGASYDIDKEIFGNNEEQNYVAFVALNVAKRSGEIKGLVKVNWLHEKKLFKPMKLKNLQSNKVAVYFDDIIKYENELFQLK